MMWTAPNFTLSKHGLALAGIVECEAVLLTIQHLAISQISL